MKTFEDDAPVRLVLPWEPPVRYENPRDWISVLANDVDTGQVREILGAYNRYRVVGSEIHFFMHTTKRKSELKKLMRHDKGWGAFAEAHPELRIEWAEDVLGEIK